MVGIGQVDGRGSHWRGIVSEPVVSVYPGDYDPSADYDAMEPTQTLEVENFGNNSAFPGEGTHVLRGFVTVEETGIYEIRPGYGNSTRNITFIGGQEIYRKEPGQAKAVNKPVKLEGGKKTPLKIIYLNEAGGSAGYYSGGCAGHLENPDRDEGKFSELVDKEGEFLPRDDVWYKGVVTATADKWLSVGCGADANSIGPELGFGHQVGNHHEARFSSSKPARATARSVGTSSPRTPSALNMSMTKAPPGSTPVTRIQDPSGRRALNRKKEAGMPANNMTTASTLQKKSWPILIKNFRSGRVAATRSPASVGGRATRTAVSNRRHWPTVHAVTKQTS